MADSPGSPLSSLASEEFTEDMKFDDQAHSPHMPPSKRRRTAFDRHTPISSIHDEPGPVSPSTSISSDTSGELPISPNTSSYIGGVLVEDDYSGQGAGQITVCRWDGCDVGDMGDLDGLVKHIHDEHLGNRPKKYSCEWSDCNRKGQTHANRSALRDHMRSHTREKPHYCHLPECDRSFTRSDALAKHMRTVHQTEALRPSDPIPKHHNPHQPGATASSATTPTTSTKTPRIKLKLSNPSSKDHNNGSNMDAADPEDPEALPIPEFSAETGFDEHELSLPPKQLYRVLRRQIHWAEKEGVELRRKWEDVLQPLRKRAWREKEAILEDVINAEIKVVGTGPSVRVRREEEEEGAEGMQATGGDTAEDMGEANGEKDDHPIKEQSPGPADDDDSAAPAENDVSMMDTDDPVDTKPPVGLDEEVVDPQPG
ncbi:hypothetical protein FQN54_003920 [Arachnomyces sp. PD_36]|nr:hypothetical protein FQN54_003920 [Arachnomyces sp. PD_36]